MSEVPLYLGSGGKDLVAVNSCCSFVQSVQAHTHTHTHKKKAHTHQMLLHNANEMRRAFTGTLLKRFVTQLKRFVISLGNQPWGSDRWQSKGTARQECDRHFG